MKRNTKCRKTKTTITFDENARKEWLQGFSKRKKERQKKAKDDLTALLKEEKKRQRDEHREMLQKSQNKYNNRLKEIEEMIEEKTAAYQCGGKTVEITEYDFANQESLLGRNEQKEEDSESEMEGSEVEAEGSLEEDTEAKPVKKMPSKQTDVAVSIEKRLNKLTHQKKKGGQKTKRKRERKIGKSKKRKG